MTRTKARRVLIGLGLVLLMSARAQAAVVQGSALLTGDQEVVPTGSSALGLASFSLDTDTNTISNLTLQVAGIGLADLFDVGPGMGPFHIHQAPAGTNGPIVVHFPLTGFDYQPLVGGFRLDATGLTISDAVEAAMLAGGTYFNVHTLSFNGGEIRGQIAVTPLPAAAALLTPALAGLGWLGWRRRAT